MPHLEGRTDSFVGADDLGCKIDASSGRIRVIPCRATRLGCRSCAEDIKRFFDTYIQTSSRQII